MNPTTIRIYVPGNNSYENNRPRLCWCGQLVEVTHICTLGLPRTDIYKLTHSEVPPKQSAAPTNDNLMKGEGE